MIPQESLGQKPGIPVRKIDLTPPPIYGDSKVGLQRLSKEKVTSDSTHHNNNQIKS